MERIISSYTHFGDKYTLIYKKNKYYWIKKHSTHTQEWGATIYGVKSTLKYRKFESNEAVEAELFKMELMDYGL